MASEWGTVFQPDQQSEKTVETSLGLFICVFASQTVNSKYCLQDGEKSDPLSLPVGVCFHVKFRGLIW